MKWRMTGIACWAILFGLGGAPAADALQPVDSAHADAQAPRNPPRAPRTVHCGAVGNERVPYTGVEDASLARSVCQDALKAARQCAGGSCDIPGAEAVHANRLDDLLKRGRITAIQFDVKSKTVWGAEVFFGHVGTRAPALSFVRDRGRLRMERWSIVVP